MRVTHIGKWESLVWRLTGYCSYHLLSCWDQSVTPAVRTTILSSMVAPTPIGISQLIIDARFGAIDRSEYLTSFGVVL